MHQQSILSKNLGVIIRNHLFFNIAYQYELNVFCLNLKQLRLSPDKKIENSMSIEKYRCGPKKETLKYPLMILNAVKNKANKLSLIHLNVFQEFWSCQSSLLNSLLDQIDIVLHLLYKNII
ncbi:hypothetical protein BpHYR1_028453 [Brachionus plicatilis]|uniref:Uncharacterized protein n=1 Tax=Brachionus plicatilis TaxID=10195 RepID=A0A3M7RFT1_BRAPC|nr:hypothetical protein BpHYR1_028453 [Brachionus plicatilis]